MSAGEGSGRMRDVVDVIDISRTAWENGCQSHAHDNTRVLILVANSDVPVRH